MNTKICFVLFLAFCGLISVKAQFDFDAVERERMAKARVRTQTEMAHDYVSGRPAARGHKSSVTKFNQKGFITEITNFDESGKTISVIIYQYDSRDNRVNFERKDGNGKLQYSQKAIFDSRGNKTREYGFDGASEYNNTFTYDAAGRVSEIVYTTDNNVTERRQFRYIGNRTEVSVYDARNALTFRQMNTYNDRSLLVSEERTGVQGNIQHTLNLKYSPAGSLTEELRRRADNKLDYQRVHHYDRNNRPIRVETTNLDGAKFVSNEYQYNANGDLILVSMRRNERATEPSTKRYTYDSRGLYTEMDNYNATYKLKFLYKYVYEFF